jgi:hypothetical protein
MVGSQYAAEVASSAAAYPRQRLRFQHLNSTIWCLLSSAFAQQLPHLLQAVLHRERLHATDGTLTLQLKEIAEGLNKGDKARCSCI